MARDERKNAKSCRLNLLRSMSGEYSFRAKFKSLEVSFLFLFPFPKMKSVFKTEATGSLRFFGDKGHERLRLVFLPALSFVLVGLHDDIRPT